MGVVWLILFSTIIFLQFSLIGQVKLVGIWMLFLASSMLCELSVIFWVQFNNAVFTFYVAQILLLKKIASIPILDR